MQKLSFEAWMMLTFGWPNDPRDARKLYDGAKQALEGVEDVGEARPEAQDNFINECGFTGRKWENIGTSIFQAGCDGTPLDHVFACGDAEHYPSWRTVIIPDWKELSHEQIVERLTHPYDLIGKWERPVYWWHISHPVTIDYNKLQTK